MTINGAILVGSTERSRPGGFRAVSLAGRADFGPFPSTTDSRTTSVGTLALTRFLRPVSRA